MTRLIDLTGKRYGNLIVIERQENTKSGQPRWKCLCDCGRYTVKHGSKLRNGSGNKCCFCAKRLRATRLIDLKGKRFGNLTVIGRAKNRVIRTTWTCKCDCGQIETRSSSSLTKGVSTQCKKCIYKSKVTHGLNGTRAIVCWRNMIRRCNDHNIPEYVNYGGRGISVCDAWKEDAAQFVKDMGHPPEKMTLERIDNNGNYTPDNCKWATYAEQLGNTRRTRRYTYNGVTKCRESWAREYGIEGSTLKHRIDKMHMTFEQALFYKHNYSASASNQYSS